ncbi:hypothetical protein KIH39_20455 [Telmatocola sphagniphila]|uniref:Lipoprotein n=1 Tax=Telmatocola sphagniphila TaxID=1123043 RepID=A0A8E6EXF5_9BACT|nr:hypothetical protein [Telmatocola sphagniphila]QVL31196.1 hypothetical protein KIH39_20455 [Telmatocola sphagniphila]
MRSLQIFAMITTLFLVGCGEKDLNKDLKPVGKDAPKPAAAGASAAPGKNSPSDGKQSNSTAPQTPQ